MTQPRSLPSVTVLGSPKPQPSSSFCSRRRSVFVDIIPKKKKIRFSYLVWIGGPLLLALQVVIFRHHFEAITSSTVQGSTTVNVTTLVGGSLDILEWERIIAQSDTSRKQRENQNRNRPPPPPLPRFNGYTLQYHPPTKTNDMTESHWPYYSKIHCVGETYPEEESTDKKKNKNKQKNKEPFEWTWMSRSCKFSLLCLDMKEKEYVLFRDPNEKRLFPYLEGRSRSSSSSWKDASQSLLMTQSTTNNETTGVSLGGINRKWMMKSVGVGRLKWFPRIIDDDSTIEKDDDFSSSPSSAGSRSPTLSNEGFYTLPPHVVMIPFHSMAAYNPGHLVWDDFLAIYTLLQLFNLADNDNNNDEDDTQQYHELLLLRHVLRDGMNGLWASCDWKSSRAIECQHMLNKFGPLMIRNHNQTTITTQLDPNIITNDSDNSSNNTPTAELQSRYVCARNGLAGLGALTDHGTRKLHGWVPSDYEITHNHGRGGNLWQFRNFMMRNLGLMEKPSTTTMMTTTTSSGISSLLGEQKERKKWNSPPYDVVFALSSSESKTRNMDFQPHIQLIQDQFPNNTKIANDNDTNMSTTPAVHVHGYQFKKFSLKEQVKIVSQAAVYVTSCGGGAVTGMYLPRGASLFIFYDEDGGVQNNVHTGEPARLDWDMWNNIGYIRVHWIPIGKRGYPDTETFGTLLRHELNVIRRERTVTTIGAPA